MPEKKDVIDSDIIISAVLFWKKIYDEKIVFIRFTKANGIDRIMKCTLDFTKIPKDDYPKSVNIDRILKLIQKNKVMNVYDLEKKGWRSVPFERVIYMDTKTKRYYVQKKK
jgi:hypothetical protein